MIEQPEIRPQKALRWVSLLLPLILVLVVLVAVWSMLRIRQATSTELDDSLVTVLRTTQKALHVWESDNRSDASFWAEFPQTRRYVDQLLAADRTGAEALGSRARRGLDAMFTPLIQEQGFLGYFIIDEDGKLLAGEPASKLGKRALDEIGLPAEGLRKLKEKAAMSLPFHPASMREILDGQADKDGVTMISVSAPIRTSRGRTTAILGFYLNPASELGGVMDLGRIGDTGESYVFDRSGRMLSESRFEPLVKALRLREKEDGGDSLVLRDPGGDLSEGFVPTVPRPSLPLTKAVQSALSGKTRADVEGYRDYRGVPVVGAWTWDDDLGLGIAIEQDVAEAFRPYYVTRDLVIFMLAVTVGGALLVSGILLRQSQDLVGMVFNLERAKGQLQDSVRSRNEFLSIASHELKTPLTSLRMQLDLINRLIETGTIREFPGEKLSRMARVSAQEVGRLSRLVQNLLDVSRIVSERFPLQLEEADLGEITRSVVERMSSQLESAGCPARLRIQEGVRGYWDRYQLEQVLANLLSNAAKYGDGKPIEVRVSGSGESASVSVHDRGKGIPPEDRERIFERFERAGPVRHDSGLGLGLYIVRRIVAQHGGKVRVESELGQGSTFIVELPKRPPADAAQTGAIPA